MQCLRVKGRLGWAVCVSWMKGIDLLVEIPLPCSCVERSRRCSLRNAENISQPWRAPLSREDSSITVHDQYVCVLWPVFSPSNSPTCMCLSAQPDMQNSSLGIILKREDSYLCSQDHKYKLLSLNFIFKYDRLSDWINF